MTAWRISYDRGTAFISGPKAEARRRIAACGDRGPLWVGRRTAWATSREVANGVLSQLEAHRVDVVLEHADQAAIDFSDTEPANRLPEQRQEALW